MQGDHDAFAALVAATAGRLLGAARLIVRDAELAHDATQDALIRAWRDLPGLRDPDRFDPWLHRLTVNACLDLLRRQRRRPIEVDIVDANPRSTDDPAGSIVNRDVVDHALGALDGNARAVIVLHYYLGLPIAEVATTLGIPSGTVKSRLNRSLSAMRLTIGDQAPSTAATMSEGQPA
jgi:RNA polymerase sigma-70 factor (ECF subfamily)